MIIIHEANGQITQTVADPVPPGHAEFLASEGHHFIELEEAPGINELYSHYYVLDGALTLRPVIGAPHHLILEFGESYTFVGLPDPCTVTVDGEAMEITGGQLEIEGDMPATYDLVFSAWPYRTATTEVKINEA